MILSTMEPESDLPIVLGLRDASKRMTYMEAKELAANQVTPHFTPLAIVQTIKCQTFSPSQSNSFSFQPTIFTNCHKALHFQSSIFRIN